MTYCVGICLAEGLVMLSDTRTNAGLDNISRFRKMFTWSVPGERTIALMTAGNLSVTQGIVTRIDKEIARAEAGENVETVLNADSTFRAAQMVGILMREMQQHHRDPLMAQGVSSDASVIIGGQRRGGRPRLFLVYAAGNFIEATEDSTFLQIGEHKYGKPILDRVITRNTSISDALKAACVSMDSTIRSNLSVGMPLDLVVIRSGMFGFDINQRIEADDPDFLRVSTGWAEALRGAFDTLPVLWESG
ncbi:MAG: peptidase [Pseudomonadota bacterium]